MHPHIDRVLFGTIVVDGRRLRHDVVILPGGSVRPREKELSKGQYGTSHILSLAEVEDLWQEGLTKLIVGGGFFGRVSLSPEAEAFLGQQGCEVTVERLPDAVRRWNAEQGQVAGLFHITC